MATRRMDIWIADDDPDDMQMFLEAMRLIGITQRIITFKNGKQLVEAFRNPYFPYPRFVVLDERMPIMGGVDVARFILTHKLVSRLNILMWSECWSPQEERFCRAQHLRCAKKPYSPHEIADLFKCFFPVVHSWENKK